MFKKLVFNCVSTSPTTVAAFIVERFSEPTVFHTGKKAVYRYELGEYDWRDAYWDEPEKGWLPLVCILWEPTTLPGHTVFMSNSSDGMSFSVSKLSRESPHRWCHVSIGDHPSLPWHNACFRYYSQETRREIMVANNERGKWTFIETGEPLPFESIEQYKKRMIRDRLDRNMIYRYLRDLDYDAESDGFWKPKSAIRLWQIPPH